jgi:hypothetical protein
LSFIISYWHTHRPTLHEDSIWNIIDKSIFRPFKLHVIRFNCRLKWRKHSSR